MAYPDSSSGFAFPTVPPDPWQRNVGSTRPRPVAQPTVTRTINPDYTALLQNDPTLQAALASLNAQGLLNSGALTGGQQQILGRLGETINPGGLPQGVQQSIGNLSGALTPELAGIVQQANQSGVSQLARLAHDYQQQQSLSTGNLAARGLLHSGAYGQHANENLRNYTLGQYDARQGALDALAGLQNNYLSQQADLRGQAATATNTAQQGINANIANGLYGPRTVTTPKPPPAAPSVNTPVPGSMAGQTAANSY